MQLSKRLQAVACLVTPGLRVADVGCDHAYISIYLAQNNISPKVIAMDINQGPLDRAAENINRYGLGDRIDIRKSNGIEKLRRDEADAILIAGMGGALTAQILINHVKVLSSIHELILQPQSEIFKVRKMLDGIGFFITKENMIKEDGKYYFMMKAESKTNREDLCLYELSREEHFHYGRLLLEQKNSILKEFLKKEQRQYKGINQALSEETGQKSVERQKEIQDKLELIRQGLEYF